MSDIERAIKDLKYENELIYNLDLILDCGWEEATFGIKEMRAFVQALKAQAERDQGCEYCQLITPKNHDNAHWVTMCGEKINYCPMCGRKLGGDEQNG